MILCKNVLKDLEIMTPLHEELQWLLICPSI